MSKKTFACAEVAGAKFVTQIKGNQKSLLKQVTHGCQVSATLESFVEHEAKDHGRIESRCGDVFDASDFLSKWPEWSAIKQIIRVKRTRVIIKKWQLKTSVTVPYYASNAVMDR